MKKLVLLLTAALAFAAVACTPDNPDNPGKDDGKDKAKELTTLVSSNSTWSVDKRLFDLSFSGEGVTLATQLIGFDAELITGKFKLVAEASAKAGDAVLEKTLLDGKAVSAGTVQVSKSGKKYTFNFTLTADGAEVALSWSGDIAWPADPEPKAVLTAVLQAQSYAAYNMKQLNVTLGTADLMTTGNGNYLSLDLYTEDAYLHEGIYHVNEVGGVLNEGEFGRAYDTTAQQWDQEAGAMVEKPVVYGSTWNSIANWQSTIEKRIEDGIVVVIRTEEGWRISWGKDYPNEYVFEGAIDALTEPDLSDPDIVLEVTSGLSYTMADETASNTADQAGTPLSGVTLWRVTVSDATDWVAAFDLVVEEGKTDLAGEYTIASYPHEAGTAGNGVYVDMDEYNYHVHCGCYFRVGEKIYLLNNDSKVKVTSNADGTLKFEFGPDQVLDAATFQPAGVAVFALDNVAKAS